MASPVFSYDEIVSEHAYSSPNLAADKRLHGGFDADGRYLSPRMRVRGPAVAKWRDQLRGRGHELIDASLDLLPEEDYPSPAHFKVLQQHGLGRALWDSLTITGIIEGRGRALIGVPDLGWQSGIVDDVAATATGHLSKGLLDAHGMDEGGAPKSGIGGHDEMWFVVRDLLFGVGAYPLREEPESPKREDRRLMPELEIAHEQMIRMMMNVLLIEIGAARFFETTCALMRDSELFHTRKEQALEAADLVDRIRQDEQIHVDYLQLVLSELRSFTLRTVDGREVAGREILDPAWEVVLHAHAVEGPKLQREAERPEIEAIVREHPDHERIWNELLPLEA